MSTLEPNASVANLGIWDNIIGRPAAGAQRPGPWNLEEGELNHPMKS